MTFPVLSPCIQLAGDSNLVITAHAGILTISKPNIDYEHEVYFHQRK